MPRYQGITEFQHDQADCSGILITNLGTPDEPTTSGIRHYLAEFLWDSRVVEKPRWLWWLILHAIILRIRPPRLAKSYLKIWTEEGSPLMAISQQQADLLQKDLTTRFKGPVKVVLGMRYGQPSISSGLRQLRDAGARRILVLPLYPQYSATTSGSTLDAVTNELRQWRWVPELRLINHYHDHAMYISALADSVRNAQKVHGQPDKLLFSFHGLPERYFKAGDPYFCECHKTARLVAQQLNLEDHQWQLTFQSRFGPEPWLQPYTDETLINLAKQGQKHVQIICPGFAADCLETLEENTLENREIFMQAGGEKFEYIPALNTDPSHIALLSALVQQHAQDWLSLPDSEVDRKNRALAMGAEQ